MSYAIVTAAIYVLAIAFLYAPKCPGAAAPAVDPTAPIDYFPEIDDEPLSLSEIDGVDDYEPAPIQGWDAVETAPSVS